MSVGLPGGCRIIDLAVKGDDRGSLVAIEAERQVPFPIARAYYLFATRPGVVRGLHAHRGLTQFAVAVKGACKMLLDDGERQSSIALDNPSRGLLLPPMVWHEMSDFSLDNVLMVFADAPYDESDYIRDYPEFRRLAASSR